MVKAVVFDVGETLVDDTRFWGAWADWLGVPHHTMSALVGAVTALGRDNADAIRLLRPGVDVLAEYAAREAAGRGEHLEENDLYPDVRPALSALRDSGAWVGIAGNQTVRAGELLRRLRLPADAIATSAEWGVAKPAHEFFTRLVDWAAIPPEEIIYVGDHLPGCPQPGQCEPEPEVELICPAHDVDTVAARIAHVVSVKGSADA
jgi:FMN phosphatase YigB (HAD superfamily)